MTYNPEEVITLREEVDTAFASTLSEQELAQVRTLAAELVCMPHATVPELEELVYRIPKSPELSDADLKKAQRAFFKTVYTLLIGRDTGPRLGTFLWAADRARVLTLLAI
jgi:lysyl-tRNA synthetase class 1